MKQQDQLARTASRPAKTAHFPKKSSACMSHSAALSCSEDEQPFHPMKTLLRIDSSIRKNGSHSRALADHFQARWCEAHPSGQVRIRDLADDPVPHLTDAALAAFHGASVGNANAAALSDTLIAELKTADELLIASPLYNFNLPSTLKAYIDHVVRFGHTFDQPAGNYRGLLNGKRACVITTRGGTRPSGAEDDFQGTYLKTALNFIGIEQVDIIAVEGTAQQDANRAEQLARARRQIDRVVSGERTVSPAEPHWIGTFTVEDRTAIDALRAGQADAVQRGDAQAYANLCADDICWMFPGHDVVTGRADFLEAQSRLNRAVKVGTMLKLPLRVERAGDLAIEVGRQELTKTDDSSRALPPRQKYTHVFRKTAQGWRFALLMSNSSD